MMFGKTFCKIALAVIFTVAYAADAEAGARLSDILNNTTNSSGGLTNFMSLFAYIGGTILILWGLFKFKAHVDAPSQVPVNEGIKRMLAGGMMLSLPFMAKVLHTSILGGQLGDSGLVMGSALMDAPLTDGGLDKMVVDIIGDIANPASIMLSAFGYVAGTAFLLVGIGRLTKRMEEGPRGPAGMGTIMTFVAAAMMFNFSDSLGIFSNTLFGDNQMQMRAVVSTDVIAEETDRARMETIIEAVMIFVAIVGYIAFLRGWFVLRAFADGQNGATVAQGLTFIIGGTLAINLGELINAIMTTANIEGLSFAV